MDLAGSARCGTDRTGSEGTVLAPPPATFQWQRGQDKQDGRYSYSGDPGYDVLSCLPRAANSWDLGSAPALALGTAFVRICLDCLKILSFFALSVTSIFRRMHGALNVGKKNN